MKNMKVATKLIVSFLMITSLAVMVGGVGIFGMTSMNNSNQELYDHNLMAVSYIGEIYKNIQTQRIVLRDYILYAGDEDKLQETDSKLKNMGIELNTLFENYESTIKDETLETNYYNSKNLYVNEFGKIKEEVRNGAIIGFEDALAILSEPSAANTMEMIVDGLTISMQNNNDWANNTIVNDNAFFKKLATVEIAILVVAIIISLFLAFYVSRLISKPMNVMAEYFKKVCTTGEMELRQEDVVLIEEMSKVRDEVGASVSAVATFVNRVLEIGKMLEMVADGDLSNDLALLSDKDTIGLSFKRMISNLNHMFGEIYNSTDQVTSGSGQIASGAQTLAQGSTEQASAVEQLSSSINEIAGKTKENANMAIHAASLGNTIKGNAEKGSHQMEQMMQAVKEINDASQSISKVIKVIDDIAFQTNILALNAAVEAARAGQHGKGFAVVAEEVRNLAAKSAEAAKDTSSLIANSIEKAELGARIAENTASSLTEIVSGINESSKIVADIADSSEEQSASIMQINKGIDQVAQVVHQNSSTAQQSAAASEELSSQSNMLKNLVAQFKLKNLSLHNSQFSLDFDKKHQIFDKTETISDYDSIDFGKF